MRKHPGPFRSLVIGIGLTVVLLGCLAAPAFGSEPGSGSGPLPAGITPVVILQGSDYEMGYQYYQQLHQLYGPLVLQQIQRTFSSKQLLALKAYQWYIKQDTPELIEFMKGAAAGATDAGVPLSYAEVLSASTKCNAKSYPTGYPDGAEGDTLPPTCTNWAVWGRTTKDGSLIGGDNLDAEFPFQVAIMAFPSDGSNSYITVARAPELSHYPGMNNKGLFKGGSGGYGVRDVESGYGLPQACANIHVLRFTGNAKDAAEMQASWRNMGNNNSLYADISGQGYIVEQSNAFAVIRKPGDFGERDFIYSRNTMFTDEGGKAILGDMPGKFYPHGGWAQDPLPAGEDPGGDGDVQMASVRTNQTLYNMFTQYEGKLDLEFNKMLYRYTGVLPQDPWSSEEFRRTKARAWETPGCLENRAVVIGQPANGDDGVFHLCTGPAGRVMSPYEAGTGDYDAFYQIGGTHTFYQLQLAATPAAVASRAKFVARWDIGAAYQKLMWMNYGDPGYEGLDALYDKANTEYYEGNNWLTKAGLTSGTERLYNYAKAVTAYTRAQAHAKEISEAIVKAPTTPLDLGLRAYVYRSYGF